MRTLAHVLIAATVGVGASCGGFIQNTAVDTTAQVLVRAQPSLQQESDFELARNAIPGALKTIEGFYVARPEDDSPLLAVLTEGYCQYGTAFVEDDWEIAKFAKKLDEVAYHNERSTHIFTRCLNYALRQLPDRWSKELFDTSDKVAKLIKETGLEHRTAMMFAGLALGSLINHNLTRPEMLASLSTVRQIIDRVIEIDKAHPPKNCDSTCVTHLALPHIALGMIMSAASPQFGGDPKGAAAEFTKALEITGNKMLLARTLMGYRVGIATNDQRFFHDELKKVLETDPAVWPEQRLANEVAHRRARRYLSHEKELFQ